MLSHSLECSRHIKPDLTETWFCPDNPLGMRLLIFFSFPLSPNSFCLWNLSAILTPPPHLFSSPFFLPPSPPPSRIPKSCWFYHRNTSYILPLISILTASGKPFLSLSPELCNYILTSDLASSHPTPCPSYILLPVYFLLSARCIPGTVRDTGHRDECTAPDFLLISRKGKKHCPLPHLWLTLLEHLCFTSSLSLF